VIGNPNPNDASPALASSSSSNNKKNNKRKLQGRDSDQANLNWIKHTYIHFLFLFFDLLCLPFALIVLCTFYRGYFLIAEVKRRVSRWANVEKQAIKVSKLFFEPPPNGRRNGFVLRLEGTKDADFVVPPNLAELGIPLYIRGDEFFWKNIGTSHGAVAATMGQNIMPLIIKPKYFNATEQIRKGETDVNLVIDFDIAPKTSTIEKKLNKTISMTNCIIQTEYGASHEGTLFGIKFKLEHCYAALAGRTPNHEVALDDSFKLDKYFEKKEWKGEKFTEVWWRVAFIQLGLFILDLLTLSFFLLLHLFPHRILALYAQMCESVERRNNRKFQQDVVQVLETSIIRDFPDSVKDLIVDLTSKLKTSPNRNAFRSELKSWFIQWTRQLTNQEIRQELEMRMLTSSNNNNSPSASNDGDLVARQIDMILKEFHDFTCQLADEVDACLNDKFPQEQQQQNENNKNNNATVYERWRNRFHAGTASSQQQQSDNANNSSQIYSQRELAHNGQQHHLRFVTRDFTDFQLDALQPNEIYEKCLALAHRSKQLFDDVIKPHLSSSGSCCDVKNNAGGVDGFRVDLKNMWWELLLDIPAIICFCFIIGTVYRLPWTIWKLSKYPHSPRRVTYYAFCEIFSDILYFLLFCISLIGIRAIYSVPYDLVRSLYYWPSFAVARVIVIHHWRLVGRDLIKIGRTIFNCTVVKFVLAASFFGALAPGVLIEGSISQEEHETGVCRAGMVLLFGLFWMFGLPFILAKSAYEDNALLPGIVFFAFFFVYYLVSVVISFVNKVPRVIQLRRLVVRNARPNWHNLSHFFWIVLELVQLLALSVGTLATFSPGIFSSSSSSSIADETVLEASRYVFLLFLRPSSNTTYIQQSQPLEPSDPIINTTIVDYTPPRVPIGVPVSMVVLILYFLLSTAPLVGAYIFKWSSAKRLRTSTVYGSLMKIFGFSFQLTVVRNLAELLSCQNIAGGEMSIQSGLVCFVNEEHADWAMPMMVFSVYYLISTLTHNVIYDEADAARSDIIVAEFYRILTNGPIVAATVLVAFLSPQVTSSSSPPIALIIVLVASLWCLLCSVFYGRFINPTENAFCTLRLIELLRMALYASSFVCSLLCIIASSVTTSSSNNNSEDNNLWVIWASLGASFSFFLAAYLYAEYCSSQNYPEEDSLDQVRRELLDLENTLVNQDKMTPAWVQARRAWRSKVEHALRPSTLAATAVHFEGGISSLHLDNFYLTSRDAWKRKTEKLIDENEKDESGVSLRDAKMTRQVRAMGRGFHDGDDYSSDYDESMCGCCGCCCCCFKYHRMCNAVECCMYGCLLCCHDADSSLFGSSSEDSQEERQALTQESITLLGQVVQTLKNGLTDRHSDAAEHLAGVSSRNNNNDDDDDDDDDEQQAPSSISSGQAWRINHNALRLYYSTSKNQSERNDNNSRSSVNTHHHPDYQQQRQEDRNPDSQQQQSSIPSSTNYINVALNSDNVTTTTTTNSNKDNSNDFQQPQWRRVASNDTDDENSVHFTKEFSASGKGVTDEQIRRLTDVENEINNNIKNDNDDEGVNNDNENNQEEQNSSTSRIDPNTPVVRSTLRDILQRIYRENFEDQNNNNRTSPGNHQRTYDPSFNQAEIENLISQFSGEAEEGFPNLRAVLEAALGAKAVERFEKYYGDSVLPGRVRSWSI